MRKSDEKIEAQVAALRALQDAAIDDAGVALVRKGLESRTARVVAAAAKLVAEHELVPLVALLAPAFARFLAEPVKTDPGCHAKLAIVEALVRLERDPDDVLARAVRYRQPEPAWGPPVDSAVNLRAHAALGLANAMHPEAANEIARLLGDVEWVARAGAARALGALPPATSVPLLRFKAHTGDEEPQVVGECFGSLLAVAPVASLEFVAEFLSAKDVIAEQAALALGGSRSEAALARLCAWRETLDGGPLQRLALVAIGLHRSDASQAYLLAVLREGERDAALHAAEALAIFRHDPRVREAILAAAAARRDKPLWATVKQLLDPPA